MSKFFQALLSGVFFTFILDFFLFLGIKLHYIDKYEINVYYNILFADNQNIYMFTLLSLLIGYITLYTSIKTALIFVGSLFILVFATLIPSIGEEVAKAILMQKNITLQTKRFSYHGDLLYSGRKDVTFFDHELKKVIILPKEKLQGFQR
ncbi:MAG: hypothetical protein FAF05_05950 [Epsilonproteobacteria bacterium]|nr:hypothetical protein [Campylobacterota bacterium]